MTWRTCVLTLFPDIFPGPLKHAIAGKALQKKLWDIETLNIRDYSHLKHKKVDDTPFGGGPGLIMRADIVDTALQDAQSKYPTARIIYLTPKGQTFKQSHAHELIERDVIFLCGRYEGIDERVIELWRHNPLFMEISMGDFVLSGGDIAVLTIIDSCVRLLPGVLENTQTTKTESFMQGLLEYPQYTKPRMWQNVDVPDVLISGNHAEIDKWKQKQALEETKKYRPDLLSRLVK